MRETRRGFLGALAGLPFLGALARAVAVPSRGLIVLSWKDGFRAVSSVGLPLPQEIVDRGSRGSTHEGRVSLDYDDTTVPISEHDGELPPLVKRWPSPSEHDVAFRPTGRFQVIYRKHASPGGRYSADPIYEEV